MQVVLLGSMTLPEKGRQPVTETVLLSLLPRPPLLEKDEVHLWCVGIDLPASRVQAFEKTLTPDELARAGGFRFKTDRNRFVAARGILRAILACYLDGSPDQLRFRYGPYGKPALDGEFGRDIRFNLAHANELALYALADRREVGIDLEQVRPHSLDERIAEQYFSAQENAMLRALPPRQRQEAFFRYWTRREAYAKARGGGLSVFLAQPDVSPVPRPMALRTIENVDRRASQWFIKELDPKPGYVAAIAVEVETRG